jgi:hypothetical protein
MAANGLSYVYPYVARSTCSADEGEHSVGKLPVIAMQVPLQNGLVNYRFGPVDELVKYDSFYERVLSASTTVCNIPGDQICMDLNGMRCSTLGKSYLITSAELKDEKIASFALSFRPVEMNVLGEVKGDEFHLYKLSDPKAPFRAEKKKDYRYVDGYYRMRYEHCDVPWRYSFLYAFRDLTKRIRMKLKF